MKAKIVNKRKEWLDNDAANILDIWTKKADELQGFEGSLNYFGINENGEGFIIDTSDLEHYFLQSLSLFKITLQKQINRENIGIPFLEKPLNYDALITIIGFSPEPLLHTILALAPEKVYPVATDESADYYKVSLNPKTKKRDGYLQYFNTIIQYYKESNQIIILEPIKRTVASIGSLDAFKRVKEIIQEIRNTNNYARIAIDITGGKKSADVAAFLTAAIENKIDIFYTDFEQYNEGKPKCGTEFLNKLDNPYNIYNIQLINQAKELFKYHNYQAAFQIFSQAEQDLSSDGLDGVAKFDLNKERSIFSIMKISSEFYMYWDSFEYADANKKHFCCQKGIDVLRELILPNTISKIYEVENQFEYVKKICYDRFANADRRYMQGRYEDSLTRYSQSLEVACKSYAINIIISKSLTVQCELQTTDTDTKVYNFKSDTWLQWDIDYAGIAGIIDWLLGIKKLNWKIANKMYTLPKINENTIKKIFCKKFNIIEDISNTAFHKNIKQYTDIIEHRNDFIHVSSLAAKKDRVKIFCDFVLKMLECLYGEVDLTQYRFVREFNEDGSLCI